MSHVRQLRSHFCLSRWLQHALLFHQCTFKRQAGVVRIRPTDLHSPCAFSLVSLFFSNGKLWEVFHLSLGGGAPPLSELPGLDVDTA